MRKATTRTKVSSVLHKRVYYKVECAWVGSDIPKEHASIAVHNSGGCGGGNFFRSIFRIAGIREPPCIVVY
jgi:hypothetical protein